MNAGKRRLQKFWVPAALLVLTVFALLIRIPMIDLGLWRDELWTLHIISAPTVAELIARIPRIDYNPPLYFMMMQAFCAVFGTNEVALHVPSIWFGLLLIPAVYWLARLVTSPPAAMLAALFAALSPQSIYYANEARNYTMAGFLYCLLSGALLISLRHRGRRQMVWLVIFSLLLTLSLYTSYMTLILIGPLALAILIIRLSDGKFPLGAYVLSFAVPCLLFFPWLPVLLYQAGMGVPRPEKSTLAMWPLVFSSNLACVVPWPFPASFAGSCILILAACTWLLLKIRNAGDGTQQTGHPRQWRLMLVLSASFLLPACILGYITGFNTGYFRYMTPFCPMGWVVIAVALSHFYDWLIDGKSRAGRIAVNAIVALLLAATALSDTWYGLCLGEKPSSGYRRMAADVAAGKYDGSLFLAAPEAPGLTFEYYLRQLQVDPAKYSLHGFPVWDIRPIDVPTYSAAWTNERAVSMTMESVDKELEKGWKRIVLARDAYQPQTSEFPTKSRVKELFAALSAKYEKTGETRYGGDPEDLTVTIFQPKR